MATRAQLIADLRAALATFFQTANTLIKAKPKTAKLSDNTKTFDGASRSDLLAPSTQALTTHAANTNNPHGLTAAKLGAPTKTEVDAAVNPKIQAGVLPLSRFGSLDNFPPGVDGSFEAASTNKGCRWKPMVLEADGTLVYLRAATNGSTKGVFYSYLRNASSGVLANNAVIRSSKRYAPPFMPANTYVGNVGNSDQNTLCGQFLNLSDNSVNGFFIALTNGTMESSSHQGVLITNAPNWQYTETFLFNDFVYAITDLKRTGRIEFQIARVSVAAIRAGGSVALEILSGWTVTSVLGTTYSGETNVPAVKALTTTDASDKTALVYLDTSISSSYVWTDGSGGLVTKSAGDPNSGRFRIRAVADSLYFSANGNSVRTGLAISLLIDPSAKIATLESVQSQRGSVTVVNGTPTAAGPVFKASSALSPVSLVDSQQTTLVTPTGTLMVLGDFSTAPDIVDTVGRAVLSGFTSVFAFLGGVAGTLTNPVTCTTAPQYGSAIGGTLFSPTFLSEKVFLINSLGANAAGVTQEGLVRVEVDQAGYTYSSINNGSLTGYAPTNKRKFLSDAGVNPQDFTTLVSTVKQDGNFVVSGIRLTPDRLSVPSVVNPDLTLGSAFTVSASVLSGLKDAILAKTTLKAAGHSLSYIEVVIANVPGMTAFAIVQGVVAGTGREVLHFADLSINISGSALASATVLNVYEDKLANGNLNRNAIGLMDAGIRGRLAAVCVYETADSWLVGGWGMAQWTGGAAAWRFPNYRFAISKSNGLISATSIKTSLVDPWTTQPAYAANATDGFCQVISDTTGTDFLTKSVLAPVAKTLTDFNAYAIPGNSGRKVMVSQDVAQGFTLYFTEATPVVLSGVQYSLPVGSLDLTTVDAAPANKTFYLYVMLVNGVAAYRAFTSQQVENYTCLYIGKITCGATKIATIAVNKVTRLGNYRVSTTPVGSALPAVTGHPATAATLPAAWKAS